MAEQGAFGVYRTRDQVENAVNELRTNAFRNEDISVLFPDNVGTKDFGPETAKPTDGTATSAIVGGTLGLLVGVGALMIPGTGPVIAAGPIMAAMAGAKGGTPARGLTGALVGLGIPPSDAKRYERLVKDGSILLSVHTEDSDWARLAKAILARTGAAAVASTSEGTGGHASPELSAPSPSF